MAVSLFPVESANWSAALPVAMPKCRTKSRQNAEQNRAKTPNKIAPKRRTIDRND